MQRKEEGMSMNREAYRLANEIRTELEAEGDCLVESLGDMDMRKYETAVLGEIRKEKRAKRRNFRSMAVAACAAVAVLTGAAVFGEEVHAAIKQIGWSISSALGLSTDLADYREVVNTSVSDNGYVITLHEAVVSQEKLTVSYTLEREDGAPMEEILVPSESAFYINGKAVSAGSGGSAGFLDEEQTVVGIMADYRLAGMDLNGEHEFRLSFDSIGWEDGQKGSWEFAFTADGSELMADTRWIDLDKEFQLPDGTDFKLEKFSSNDLEQRMDFSWSGGTRFILMIKAESQAGAQVEFGMRSADEKGGYLQNEEIIDDGRMEEGSGEWTMTLYAVELPETDGRIPDDYVQVGEPFILSF